MRRGIGWTLAIVVALAIGAGLYVRAFAEGSQRAEYWADAIEAFEAADRDAPPPPGAIVFTGSSSIRMWGTLERDMAPRRVLNRGFGGAHMDHVNAYAARIVLPYRPSAVVVYAGDNDVAAGKDAARVVADFERFVEIVREGGSRAPILYVAIKPSPRRWDSWPEMVEANERIAALCDRDPLLHYVDVATPMLAEASAGEPPPRDLFLIDGLHLSTAGYTLWTRSIRHALDQALPPTTETTR